jgi:hypothetical protein
MSSTTGSTTTAALPKVETAWDWLQRVKKEKAAPPNDPHGAAWAFCRGATGIAFVDAALKQNEIPTIDIRGSSSAGKTLTVISLAARFVVDTRAAAFDRHPQQQQRRHTSEDEMMMQGEDSTAPHVFLLDSQQDISMARLLYAVRTTLLRRHTTSGEVSFEDDLKDCLRRIHLVTSSDGFLGWVPVLEALRHKLRSFDTTPTLILWNGFLTEPEASNEVSRTLIIRLVQRILTDCTVLWITTTHRRLYEWERHVSQKIHLDGGFASVHRTRIPFQLTMYGVLS